MFEFILKFCFLFSATPSMKISNTFLPPVSAFNFEKIQFPPDFVEFKNPVPLCLPLRGNIPLGGNICYK